jgi:uncharacterized protein
VTTILHLIPLAVWNGGWREPIEPESLATEGFVHCTGDDATLLRVANQFYRSIEGTVLALSIDTEWVESEIKWEHPPGSDPLNATAFPHIYGPIPRRAVTSTRVMTRDADGSYTGYGTTRAVINDTAPILPSRDLERTAGWYGKLGFTLDLHYPNQYLIVERDGFHLHFFHQPNLVPIHNDHGAFMWVSDADALHREWLAAGAEGKLGQPELAPYGINEGSYIDLDSNLIRFGNLV